MSVSRAFFAIALLACTFGLGAMELVGKEEQPGHKVADRRFSIENAFISWARENAVSVDWDSPAIAGPEAAAVKKIIGNSSIVALGEPAHGTHEPLAYRNRLFRFLVEECGYTAIAMETGFTEARLLNDYVLGGPSNPFDIVQRGFTWGFGSAGENLELLQWLRSHNSASERKVRIYGIDIAGGSSGGEIESVQSTLDAALALMEKPGVEAASDFRRDLKPFLRGFSQKGYSSFSASERSQFRAVLHDLIRAVERHREALVAASSRNEYDWALHDVIVARQVEQMLSLLPPDPPGGGLSPEFYKPANARDLAMAANVSWALQNEGPHGKILIFAHNAHVVNAPLRGGLWSVYRQPAVVLGQHLRKTFGHSLRIIATSSSVNDVELGLPNTKAGTIDGALHATGRGAFILNMRSPVRDTVVQNWLNTSQSLRANLNTETTFIPSLAIDAIVHFPSLSKSRPAMPTPAHKTVRQDLRPAEAFAADLPGGVP